MNTTTRHDRTKLSALQALDAAELENVEGGAGWEDILGALSAPLSNILKAFNDLSQTIVQNLR
jgi:COMC family